LTFTSRFKLDKLTGGIMPTYEYKCDSCEHKFEAFQSIKADPIKVCPECNKEEVTKLISGGMGVIYKGSGFYTTDYKNAKKSEPSPCSPGGCGGGASCPNVD
jgi:putative FmdB family regulatory protein